VRYSGAFRPASRCIKFFDKRTSLSWPSFAVPVTNPKLFSLRPVPLEGVTDRAGPLKLVGPQVFPPRVREKVSTGSVRPDIPSSLVPINFYLIFSPFGHSPLRKDSGASFKSRCTRWASCVSHVSLLFFLSSFTLFCSTRHRGGM